MSKPLRVRVWIPAPPGTHYTEHAASDLEGQEAMFDECPAKIIEAKVVDNGRHISAVYEYRRQ